MIILDVLNALVTLRQITFKELSNVLKGEPDRSTLRKYLGILVDLGLISIERTGYRGITKSKNFFEITEKGRDLINSLSRIMDSSNL